MPSSISLPGVPVQTCETGLLLRAGGGGGGGKEAIKGEGMEAWKMERGEF